MSHSPVETVIAAAVAIALIVMASMWRTPADSTAPSTQKVVAGTAAKDSLTEVLWANDVQLIPPLVEVAVQSVTAVEQGL